MLGTVTTAPRYSDVDRQKSDGAIYTPIAFARFVAEQMLQVAELPQFGKIRVLDPACGDGALLDALIENCHLHSESALRRLATILIQKLFGLHLSVFDKISLIWMCV